VEIRISDELWAAVAGLCFKSIDNLRNDRAYVYSYFVTNLCVVLIPVGDTLVHVVGDEIDSFDTYKDVFMQRLFACGLRYIAFLERLSEDPDHRDTVQTLREIAGQVVSPF
jgi:hypothetical protein